MPTRQKFPVVGIGASAGGIEAMEGLFTNLPADSGCAFVIITHLNPHRPSRLPEIVSHFTQMPVKMAEDGAALLPDEVQILPPDAIIDIERGRLKLRKIKPLRRDRKPIDIFFAALAREIGEYAAGVVLSGGDADGTLGVKAIKERGGLTLAQVADGTPPQNPDMPESAIASGMIDLAIPVQEMGPRLVEFAKSFRLFDGMAASVQKADGEREAKAARDEVYAVLRNQIGHDFSGYKEKTFMRRVQRRMQVSRVDSIEAYVERLRRDPKEVGALFRDLLISVTTFFRDAEAFAVLEKHVIPALFDGRGAADSVRIWVPGCATGEEVFSIAMLMREHMDTLSATPRVQIFATDIDERALLAARSGRYPEALLDSVSPARRERFFIPQDGSFLLAREVRDLCVFSPHSVIRDPPFSRLDMISCRNLLIYFGPDVQNQVIPTFHYALKPGGFLLLGTSENVTQFPELFTPLDKKQRVFRSRGDAPTTIRLPLVVSGLRPAPFAPLSSPRRTGSGIGLRQSVESQIIDRFAPAHVVVNREGDVVHYSARTGKYLEATAGAPTRQLLAMARKGLQLDLRAGLREAVETERRVIREGLMVESEDGRFQRLDLTIEPLPDTSGEGRLFLCVFNDLGPSLSSEEAAAARPASETAIELERELRETRERLQSLIEEYETALEELKSSNEELTSVNEELQSTNEELEASKEELQSLNEELHTVNAELSGKVEQLDNANTDLNNLFESTQVATLFLDRSMRIRSFTPEAAQIFSILPSDRGRPLTDLVSRVKVHRLAEDVALVLNEGRDVERKLEAEAGQPHYLQRLSPYRGLGGATEGVVLTFIDITSISLAEQHERVLIAELNHRVKNMLGVVISIAEQTYRTTEGREAFKDSLIDRIVGLSRSYELLSEEHWTAASIAQLLRPHLEPFGLDRVRLSGAEVRLRPAHALSLGMVLHELATNAGKYGALSSSSGSVKVEWRERPGPDGRELALVWRELDGPEVSPPTREGFGLTLVQRETEYRLGGDAQLQFEPGGLVVRLTFPLEGTDGT